MFTGPSEPFAGPMLSEKTTVAWISDFPLEWLDEIPDAVRVLPRRHPATWQLVLLGEFQKNPALDLQVISLRQRIRKPFKFQQGRATFHVLKAPAWGRLASVFWWDTLLIRRLCKEIKPDLVHAWGMEKAAGLVASRLPYPYAMTVQGLYAWYKEQVPLSWYESYSERLERIALPRAPVVTTESRYSVNYLKKLYPHLRVHQAEHAPNRAFFQVQRRPQLNPMHFLSIGTLGYRKGTDLLFNALDRLTPEIPFRLTIICGPAPEYIASLKATVSRDFWERIEFKHHILPHEVARELETPAVMLLPTRADVSPNAVKESAVAGVPVIAGETGGVPDYVQSGKNGLLFPIGNLDAFVSAIREAVRHPLFSRGLVDPESFARSRDYLSPARMAENFLSAYKLALQHATP
jgi:glycosyltransferase involved in cell wall biosynthesis